MELKELGMRFMMSYLMSRASGTDRKEAATDSLIGSTLAQAREDITGFTPEIADVTTQVVSDLVVGHRAKQQNVRLGELPTIESSDINAVTDLITDPSVGINQKQITEEVQDFQSGVSEAFNRVLDLDRLKAGVIKRD